MADYVAEARRAARRYGIDPGVFVRQIRQESGFNPGAVSPAGAIGIAQIMPATARGWGVNPRDPTAALDAAARNMAKYVRQYGGYRNALIAYNAGPGAVGRGSLPAETQNYIKTILGGREPTLTRARAARAPSGGGGTRTTRTITQTTPGVDNRVARAALIQSFLEDTGSDPLQFALQARQLQDIPATSTTHTVTTGGGGPAGSGGGGDLAAMATQRANAIDAQRLPYVLGGGHQGQTPLNQAVPLDCSGAVSKVLGIDPRVSGDFAKWGRPGDGGDKGVTVYSNGTHVLMKINGHFFATSRTNPGGGAGWIPASAISPQYLAGFTARHSER
ncbi:MAG TPA: lytic transglycosylase domain-containing protein [Acetobacteraceae bacterium]|nr:lytic transglycosylase domain-containing protein [Acetobacteraceae bacterium]